ncbi:unnamed protein product, partial [Allacma fusca]
MSSNREGRRSQEGAVPSPSSLERQLRHSEDVPTFMGVVGPANTILKKDLLSWDFDIFEYNEKTSSAFKDVCFSIVKLFEVDKTFKVDEQTVLNWLDLVERTYKPEVPYHNSIHAADVLQAMACFLSNKRLKRFLSNNDRASLVIASIVHDIHHPGFVSAALKNLKHRLCVKNVEPFLESHHIQTAFKVTLGNEHCNIFKNLDPETFSMFEKDISDLILATDMEKHGDYYNDFRAAVVAATQAGRHMDWKAFDSLEKKLLMKQIILKNADVAACQRPLHIHITWTEKICREFHRQTETEIRINVEPTYPEYKELCVLPSTQLMFLEVIRPMIEDWDRLLELPGLQANFKRSLKFWQKFKTTEKCSFEEVKEASKNE